MENDKGAYFLGDFGNGDVRTYDNAEAARIDLHADAEARPDNTRRLFKVLPFRDPIEIMV